MNQHGKDDIDDDELEKTARLSNQSGEHAQNAIEKVKSENNDGSYQKMKSLEYAMEEMKMMAIYDAMNFQCVQEEVLAQLIEAYAEQVLKVTSEMGAPRNKEMIIAECTEEINRIYRNGLSQKKRAIKIASKNN